MIGKTREESILSPGRSFAVFIFTLFVLLVLIAYQISDPTTGRSVLTTLLLRLFSPFQYFVAETYDGATETVRTYFSLTETNRENARLAQENTQLRVQLSLAERETRENERLRRILKLSENSSYEILVGEVIAFDAKSMMSRTVTVNRGSRHGVRKELAVVSPAGAVGTTIVVDPLVSRIQLITDSSSAIGGILEKNKEAGILFGVGSGRCILRFLPLNMKVVEGEVVRTSGQDDIFPEGYPVGIVTRELSESQFYRSVEVQLFENLSTLHQVIFLMNRSTPPSIIQEPGQNP